MNIITLRAHFDGEQIVLDEPFKLRLKPNTRLIVTVLPEPESDQEIEENDKERQAWLQMSMKGLENAYSEDEVEYTLDLIKESNPEYERR
jgi:predicted metal-dependent hydrolase